MRMSKFGVLLGGCAAVLIGAAAHEVLAKPDHKCTTTFPLTCPAAGICQGPGHCGITPNHKCVNVAPNNEFNKCIILLGQNCAPSATGCMFEEYTGPGCVAATGIIRKPLCYDECI
jgi:hypothetical protein